MARVLLAWEFGGDLGHMMRVLAIAHELRDRGHEPLLAFSDLGALGTLAARGIPAFAAPLVARPSRPDPSPLNHSDILLNLGLGDPAALAGALAGWSGLLHLLKPALVVADYAPTALIAARASRLSTVAVGNGFSDPPRGRPMPALRSWIASDERDLSQRDARLVKAVREALGRTFPRASLPETAAALFEADARIVCTWPMLDPFGPRDDVEYVGPQGEGARTQLVSWRSEARARIVAYLKPRDARFAATVEAIRASAGEALIAAPGLDAGAAAALSDAKVRVVAAPITLDILAEADLCVSHSSLGMVSAALAHGIPQAVLPGQLEQHLVARRLVALGVARVLDAESPASGIPSFMESALGDTGLREAARHASKLDRPLARASARIAAMVEA